MELIFVHSIVDVWYQAKECLESRNKLSYNHRNVVEIFNQDNNV